MISETGSVVGEEEVDTSEMDIILYQEFSDIMKEFPNTSHAGEDLNKIRTVLSLPGNPEEVLIVLDDFPNSVYVDFSGRLQGVIGDFNDLETVKNWIPGKSHTIDVLQEVQTKATQLLAHEGPSMRTQTISQSISAQEKEERRPEAQVSLSGWMRQIMENFEASQITHPRLGSGLEVNLYTMAGERCWIRLYPSNEKPGKFIFQVDKYLQGIPAVVRAIERQNAGTLAALDVLATAERALLGVE